MLLVESRMKKSKTKKKSQENNKDKWVQMYVAQKEVNERVFMWE